MAKRRRGYAGPVIAGNLVADYLGRQLDEWDWIKGVQREELLKDLPRFKFSATYDPYLHQLQGMVIGIYLRQFCFFQDMGAGKAQPVSEPVLTPKGWKAIGSLKAGDFVIGALGKPVRILSVHPQGVKEVFEVSFSDGGATRCCEDHLWAITSPTRKWLGLPNRVVALKDMPALRSSYAGDNHSKNSRYVFIPVTAPVEFESKGVLPLDPYLLGAWLGDGSGCGFTTADQEMIDRLTPTLPVGVRLVKRKQAYSYGITAGKKTRTPNPFGAKISLLGLQGTTCYDKFIPEVYLFSSVAARTALLQGLMDTDGYVSPSGGLDYSTSSKRLCDDFVFLVRSLGGTAKVRQYVAATGNAHFGIRLVLPPTIQPCLLTRKTVRLQGARRRRLPPTRAMTDMAFAGAEECVCISVDAEDGLYLTKDFVVTHNTALMLALYRWFRARENIKPLLVLVPKDVHIQSWVDEIAVHAPELSYVSLSGAFDQKVQAIDKAADVFILNYPGLQGVMTTLERIGKGKKRKRQIDPKTAKAFASMFGMVVFDESHRIGNSQSLVYRECRHFTKFCELRYALTGTPFGRDPTMLWSQFDIIDNGETLGNTLGLFRAAFFNAKQNYFGGLTYEFDERMEQDLHQMIKHRSVVYQDGEFSDLPPLPPPQVLRCHFTVTATEQYRNVVRRVQEARGSRDELKHAFVRMRMCTSGFLSVKEDGGDRLTMYFEENPKLDTLEEMLGDIPEDCKAIIYYEYTLTGAMIGKMLRKQKYKYTTLSGQTPDQRASIRAFLHDPKVRFLVANNQTGSDGINPQGVCSYLFFYEAPTSPITRQQAIKRVHRKGQKRRVHIYDLIVPGSIDERVLEFQQEGKDLFEAIIQGDITEEAFL